MSVLYLKYLISLFLLASNGIVASFITIPSYEIAFFRLLIALAFLAIVFFSSKNKKLCRHKLKDYFYLLCSGMTMGFSGLLIYEAFQLVGVGIATLICNFGPAIIMILSPLVFKEAFTSRRIIAFAIVFAGEILLNVISATSGASLLGLFYAVMSAVFYAMMVIFNKKVKAIRGLEKSVYQYMAAFLSVAVFVLSRYGLSLDMGLQNWLLLLLLGIVNTGIGGYLFFASIERLPVQTVAILSYLDPLFAVILAAIILNEKMTPLNILGAVMILGGAVYGEYKKKNTAALK